MENKIIFIDWGVFLHRSIFLSNKIKMMPPDYIAFNMLIATLKRLTLHPDDTIIIAVDSPLGSWRKEIDGAYKSNRKEKRDKHTDINWEKCFAKMDNLLDRINTGTSFQIIKLDKIEADDIIAYGVKFFKDKQCIVVSTDSDFEQLCYYPNVKLFSPISKKEKIVKNPYKSLQKKIAKETTDNLVSPILSESDYEKRHSLVNLFSLPSHIEETIDNSLKQLNYQKDFDINTLPFAKLRASFMLIYNPPDVQKKKTSKKDNKTLPLDSFLY